ncbi:hypothetical protein Fleli_3521 [Bernardetia litoralis DSM 6794]|uniref:Uncharacterized protein n=1 Tax=Bernardetia litoralis (strain ATCC 23117 / DSM 6794 / NBRC 15988 / NCIMB 1366 / Fx l1 / Sio-4) TaxID=880071 RepID=I4APF6_BERLS|nr:hypothetical protein [Bernardetia litoralis]AFM05841.1 hypothetical protein Fleli_3521 [Bernardetia litoralis DSM 6794]
MLSKNFIFTALFFGIILFCISCLGSEKKIEYKQLYTILPTDSSNFNISLDGIETIKTPTFDLDGKWKLIGDTTHKTEPLYLTFEGRKIYSTLDFDSFAKKEQKEDYQVFAIYDKCIDEGGIYNKKGNFLVIGSGDKKLICYQVTSYKATKITLYDVAKGDELKFEKIE